MKLAVFWNAYNFWAESPTVEKLQMFDQFFILFIATGAVASERETYEVIDEEFPGAGLYEKVNGDTMTYKKVDGPDEDGDFNFLLASPTDPRQWRLTFGKNKDDAMNEENTYYKVGCDKIEGLKFKAQPLSLIGG